ncbi:MAG: hypothetical protein JEZ08_22435 [Clostridiales bacterium]|nr:hypothetical protein [Clostridiales bacterium]
MNTRFFFVTPSGIMPILILLIVAYLLKKIWTSKVEKIKKTDDQKLKYKLSFELMASYLVVFLLAFTVLVTLNYFQSI